MIPSFSKIKIITSEYAVVEYQKVVGIPDKRRSNTRRPFYRWVKRLNYPIYVIRGGTAVLHPSMMAKIIHATLDDSQVYKAFTGMETNPDPEPLTIEKFKEVIGSIPPPEPSLFHSLLDFKPIIPDDDQVDVLAMRYRWRYGPMWIGVDKAGDS